MSKNLSNRDIIPGETLYQYLKRKKQISLKQSVQNSLHKQFHNQQTQKQADTKRYSNAIQTCRSFQFNTRRHQQQDNKQNQSIHANHCKSTQRNHPIKSIYNQRENSFYVNNQKSASRSKSFIEMISPLKNIKSNSTNRQKQRVNSLVQKNISKGHQIHNKNIIQESLRQLKSKIQASQSFEKEIKVKFKTINSAVLSLFVQIQNKRAHQINEQSIDKKIKKLKSHTKLLQNFLLSHKFEKSQILFQKFNGIVYENLNYFQVDASKTVQQQIQRRMRAIKVEYEQKMTFLKKQNSGLERSLQIQDKKIIKIQKQYNILLCKFNNLSQKADDFYQQNQIKFNQATKSYKNQIQIFKQELKAAHQDIKQLSLEVIHLKYKNQQQIKKLQDLHKKKWSQKQLIYVRQIQILKAQYQKQIGKYDDFTFQKQEDSFKKVSYLQMKIQNLEKQKRNLEVQLAKKQKQIQEILQNYKPLKSKNQNLLTDLYRMNQQLYQHWLGLKDIKVLLKRLNLFDKFSIIYKDLKFNETLFA